MDGDAAVEITIRVARREDAATIHQAIRDLAEAVGDSGKVLSSADDFRRHGFGASPAFGCLVAEKGKIFAGLCLHFPSFSTWFGKPGVYVQDLFIAPEFRGRGVGEKLLQRLAADTREAGGEYLRLSVHANNSAAQRFYERAGLSWSKDERIFAARGNSFRRLAEGDRKDR
ncbi:GNAT family N-acetyltransferase [Mesorhizobium sp. NBSH29]|uniref:GNAT family N-acetyltransferase n=1 Tax=Mesorhizobium sp. NBSH29 TaxID=2654249 RepID=UPI00189658D1|nr:GNAT family N-acetyltransferase [Mesorhizobium sp. NBSH29]QPC85358.1 GNAT family N-acetyltransferase [Mesorhizobium sp. NBSH29]